MEEKRKRGRPRKVVIPDELQNLIDAAQRCDHEEFKQIVEQEKEKATNRWDVKKDDPIPYFDKRLSYEITGYKPITADKGLDFNPNWFTEARDKYKKTNHYTAYRPGTKAYSDFWDQEYIRCRDGYTVNGYTVTGPHYYYLNYYQLPDVDVDKLGSGRLAMFPRFLVF